MKLPVILLNLKTHPRAAGYKALELAKIAEEVSKEYSMTIAVAPQYADIYRVASEVDIPVFAQHIDPVEPGRFTGYVSALSVKEAGAAGSLINHSERKLDLYEVKDCIDVTKKYNLISVCCSEDLHEAKGIAKFVPDFIAYEPPELIGTGMAVSKAKPKAVSDFVKLIRKLNNEIKPLCGAGIERGKDAGAAIELGTCGVLVHSAFVKAVNPRKALEEFSSAIQDILNRRQSLS